MPYTPLNVYISQLKRLSQECIAWADIQLGLFSPEDKAKEKGHLVEKMGPT